MIPAETDIVLAMKASDPVSPVSDTVNPATDPANLACGRGGSLDLPTQK